MTIIIDDAGSGDLLFGVVIGCYDVENQNFRYDVIDVKYFQPPFFSQKEYLREASKIVFSLLQHFKLKQDDPIKICKGYIFDVAVEDLVKKFGQNRIYRIKVIGDAQLLTETAYLEEIQNLGYQPIEKREEKRAKSFFHMMRWLSANKKMMKYAKTGWPRLYRYRLFKDSKYAPLIAKNAR